MKHKRRAGKAACTVLAAILAVSMIVGLSVTTTVAAGFDAASDLTALGRHLAGIETMQDQEKLSTANLTGDETVNAGSLVLWARSWLRSDKSPDLIIKQEKTLTGGTYHNVIIDASVGDGTVILDDVTIKGQLIVQGGGSNSIKVQNCEVESVVLDKDTSDGSEEPRLELTGTTVETVEVTKPAIIESNSASGEAAIGEVKAAADVTVQGAATSIGTVTVPKEAKDNDVKLKVNGAKVETVSAAAPVTITADATAAKIENVEAKDNVTVAGNTKIDTITVPDEVETVPEISVNAGSVNTVKAESPATVSGTAENAIANVEAAAPVEVSSTAVAQVTVTVNVTVTVKDNGEIEVKVDTDTAVEIQAESTENLSVSTTATTTTNITVKQGEDIQEVHIHKWAEISRTDAGCVTTGTIRYRCSECGETKTEIVPAKGHTEVLIPAVAPTCTVAGSTAGKKCAVCAAVIVEPKTVPAPGHDFAGSYVSDETGHWHVCSRCGVTDTKGTHTYDTDNCEAAASCTVCGYQKAAGTHNWTVSQTTPATCTAAGSVKYTCTSCPATKTEPIPALGHIYGAPVFGWDESNMSCTVSRTCTREGCLSTEPGHAVQTEGAVTSYVLKAPTCMDKGVTVYTAAVTIDGRTYTDTKSVDMAIVPHQFGELIPEVPASGTADGIKAHYHCAVCGQNFDAQKVKLMDLRIPAPIKTVTTAEEFISALSDADRTGALVNGNITLASDTSIPAGKSVEIVSGKTLTVSGELRVYGTLTNHGTISGGKLEVYGGTLENEGSITLTGENSLLTVEKGGTLNNFVGDIDKATVPGTINADINFVDYYYADQDYLCEWNVIGNDHTLDIDGEHKMVVAAVFDTNKISTALSKTVPTTVPGEDGEPISIDVYKYNAFLLSGTEANSTVHLGGVTVPERMLMILKDSVFDGTATYHNSFVVDNGADMVVSKNAKLFSRGGASLTVASGSKLTANGNMRLENLTVGGHVYTEEGGLDVTTALTVNAGGVLEIGSGSSLNYLGENDAVVNGKLIKTVRYVNGFEENVTSHIEGVEANDTLTTLVFTEDIVLTGEHTVDIVVAYGGTLRVAPGGSLRYKEVYRGEGYTGAIIGSITEEDGYKVLRANDTTVTDYDGFVAALGDDSVTYVTVNGDIIVPGENHGTQLDITKPVVIADDCKFTVAHYEGDDPQRQIIINEVIIKNGGSLTLGSGAELTATEVRSTDGMFFRYLGRIYVENSGKLDVSAGTVTSGSAIYFDYGEGNEEPDSENLKLDSTTVDNLGFVVWSEDQLRAAMTDGKCTGGIEANADIELTDDLSVDKYLLINDGKKLTVPAGKKLIVPAEQTLQLSGSLFVFDGTVTNHGTIYGFDTIDVVGGLLENDGTIVGMFAPNDRGETECISLLVVENGGTLNNFVGDIDEATASGIINDEINFVDYWYTGEPASFTDWNVREGDHTLDGMGQNIQVIAIASPEQVQDALDCASGWGEFKRYTMVMATGMEEENEVTLSNLTVNPYQTLLLKESVFDAGNIYHNAVYNLSDIDFAEGAGLVIKGAPVVNINGTLNYHYLIANEGAVINGNGFVHSAEQLADALEAGGKIYVPYEDALAVDVSEDFDQPEGTSFESQYHVTDAVTINESVELINPNGAPVAVFFDDGFTVPAGTTLRFDGLNVVAAKDSSVGGRVEVCNGILVVQANSEDGATLTIEENGVVQVGNPDCGGNLAIFPKDYDNNNIVNHGTIECFGGIMNWNWGEDDNQPLWFVNYRDLVCDLNREFGNMPGLDQIDFTEDEEGMVPDLGWVYLYPDGGQVFLEQGDFEAIGSFAWLIKNEIIPAYDEQEHPELRPYHYVTRDEVQELFDAFASVVLGKETRVDLPDGGEHICRTENFDVPDNRPTSDKNLCFDALRQALSDVTTVTVDSEEAFLNALDAPYVTEIRLSTDTTLRGSYYKDGERVDEDERVDDELSCYLWGAGQDRNGERRIIVEPGVTLTVNPGVKVDIKEGVQLRLADENGSNGKLDLYGGLNVFGELKPDNWNEEFGEGDDRQRKYVIEEEGSYINFFPDVMEFAKRLWECVGDRVDPATATDIASYADLANDWPYGDGRESFFAFAVKYGIEPADEENGSFWRPYNKITYGEAITVLDNLYEEISGEVGSFTLGEDWENEWLVNDHDIENLLEQFVNALPQAEDDRQELVIRRHDGSEDHTDGMTIVGRKFTKAVTITCDTEYLDGDDWGGEIRFQNCSFIQGVTVQAENGINFKVDFTNSCSGSDDAPAAMTVAAPVNEDGTPAEYAYEDDGNYCRSVELLGVNNMNVDAQTYVRIREVWNQKFSLSFNGSTIEFDGENTNNYFEVGARWDRWWDDQEDKFLSEPCLQINAEESWHDEEHDDGNDAVRLTSVPGSALTCKLRVCGFVDVSELTVGTGGRIELANDRGRSDIRLGENDITVCGDCGGEYSFSGSGTVYVPDQNGNANITINEVFLGQPHIYGDGDGCGIFFPVSSDTDITVEQGRWDDQAQCATDWRELTYAVQEGGDCIQLVKDGSNDWIEDPYQVRVTVTVSGGEVVYDTLWWKPIYTNEFLDLLNGELGKNYVLPDDLNGDDYLTYGSAKRLLSYVWEQYPGEGELQLNIIINDEHYWNELDRWENDESEDRDDWCPDNWTRHWNDAHDMVWQLKEALGIEDQPQARVIDDDVTLILQRTPGDDGVYPWRDTVIVDRGGGNSENLNSNRMEEWRFTGNVTVTCDPTCKDDENFAGRVFLQNCAFEQDVTVQPVDGVTFCVDFTNSCTWGTENASAAVWVPGLESYSYNANNGNYENAVQLCGVGNMDINANSYVHISEVKDQKFNVTFNGSTIEFDGVNTNNDFRVNLRWDRWKDDPSDTDYQEEPCLEVTAQEFGGVSPVKLTTLNDTTANYKLRVCGCVDISGLRMGNGGLIELGKSGETSNSTISFGESENEIKVYDNHEGDSLSVSGKGIVWVYGGMENFPTVINGYDLGAPHVFGSEGSYGIYLGLTELPEGITFEVKQGDTVLNSSAVLQYGEDGSATKCHLEQNGGEWITQPNDVSLTATINGCKIVYENLHYNGQ